MSGRNISVSSEHGNVIPAGFFSAIQENNSDLYAFCLFTGMAIRPAIELLKVTVYSKIVLAVITKPKEPCARSVNSSLVT